METWPCHPKYLRDRVSQSLLSLIIAGMCERLEGPVVLMEPNPGDPFTYPVDDPMKRYPGFCQALRKIRGGKELCHEDSYERGKIILGGGDVKIEPRHCHMRLLNIPYMLTSAGRPLAICTSGKFIRIADRESAKLSVEQLHIRLPWITREEKNNLIRLVDKIPIRDEQEFQSKLTKEINLLEVLVTNFLAKHRRQQETECQKKVLQFLYQALGKPDKFSNAAIDALKCLREFLDVEYVALFLSKQPRDKVLPLFAQSGIDQKRVESVHFNWRKAGFPVDPGTDLMTWFRDVRERPDFPVVFLNKGVRGNNSNLFHNSIHLVPAGTELPGVLLIGPWKSAVDNFTLLRGNLGGRNFIESIGHLLITQAATQSALNTSLIKDTRRDLIVSMTAHSIRSSVHKLLDTAESIMATSEKASFDIQDGRKIRAYTQKQIDIIGVLKKNVELAMVAPHTAVMPSIHPSELDIKPVNLASLIANCVERLEPQGKLRNISVNVTSAIDDLPIIQGDYYLLDLMFSNIIDNAIKYSRENKFVLIERDYEKSKDPLYVIIFIQDVGWGISPDEKEKIFEAGFETRFKHKVARRGVGLGLYQTQQFVKLHGGMIFFESNLERKGSPENDHIVRFYVRLPILGPKK